ncbi:FeoA domain-containing protein [Sphingobium nicotianae]|uniref:FeoA domain-containing protein n=1 Tax=Sphingobium nicotianae TaxID=2782607 RepID=A0A9X1DEM3_9SPHN|nr:FeoA domain-containing protein [Sphingobium nicotianae]
MLLTKLTPNLPAYVDIVDWSAMSETDGRRLRELGLCEGASIELLHRAGFTGRGAHACRVGRMIVAMRAAHAAAITVRSQMDPIDSVADGMSREVGAA